MGMGPGARERF